MEASQFKPRGRPKLAPVEGPNAAVYRDQHGHYYDAEGCRLTTCCGSYSSIFQDTGELYCKCCYEIVFYGEGTGGLTVNVEECLCHAS